MKWVVMVPLLMIFAPLLLGIVWFIKLMGKLVKNARVDEWEGEVVNKSHNTKDKMGERGKEHFYILYIKTTKGEERKLPVISRVYSETKVGDKYIKVRGELNPRKMEAAK